MNKRRRLRGCSNTREKENSRSNDSGVHDDEHALIVRVVVDDYPVDNIVRKAALCNKESFRAFEGYLPTGDATWLDRDKEFPIVTRGKEDLRDRMGIDLSELEGRSLLDRLFPCTKLYASSRAGMGRGPVSVEPGGMDRASFQLLGGQRLEIRDKSRYG